jgi:hypothetical protein
MQQGKKKMLNPIPYKITLGIIRYMIMTFTVPAQGYVCWTVDSRALKAPISHLPGIQKPSYWLYASSLNVREGSDCMCKLYGNYFPAFVKIYTHRIKRKYRYTYCKFSITFHNSLQTDLQRQITIRLLHILNFDNEYQNSVSTSTTTVDTTLTKLCQICQNSYFHNLT